jgi:hypothetical protein
MSVNWKFACLELAVKQSSADRPCSEVVKAATAFYEFATQPKVEPEEPAADKPKRGRKPAEPVETEADEGEAD